MKNSSNTSFFDEFNYRVLSVDRYTIDTSSYEAIAQILDKTYGDSAYNGNMRVAAGRLTNDYAAVSSQDAYQFWRDYQFRFYARFRLLYTTTIIGMLGVINTYGGATDDWIALELNTNNDAHWQFAASVLGVVTRVDMGAADTDWHELEIRCDEGPGGDAYLILDGNESGKYTMADANLPDTKYALWAYAETRANVPSLQGRGWEIDYWGFDQIRLIEYA